MKQSHQLTPIFCLLATTGLLFSCSHGEAPDESTASRTVSVSFNTSVPEAAAPAETSRNLNVLAFRQTGTANEVEWAPLPDASWSFLGKDKGYQMTCQLATGIYHFTLSQGLSVVDSRETGDAGSQCYWVSDPEPQQLNAYTLRHPMAGGKLKDCTADLYLNREDQTEAKHIQSQQNFQTRLTHAQARLDVVFARQGSQSPFARIQQVSLELYDVTSSCGLAGEVSQEEKQEKADYTSQILTADDFAPFDVEGYKQEFEQTDNLSVLLNSLESATAGIRKWRFFPTSSVSGKLHVTYQNGYEQEAAFSNVHLEENMATLLVVWVDNEHLVLSPEGIGSGELSGTSGQGESGFWN